MIVAVLFLAGCGKSYVGTYISQQHADRYLELKSDGTFFCKDSMTMSGTYKMEDQTITLTTPMGMASRGTLDGDTMTDPDGVKWTKK